MHTIKSQEREKVNVEFDIKSKEIVKMKNIADDNKMDYDIKVSKQIGNYKIIVRKLSIFGIFKLVKLLKQEGITIQFL